MGNLRPRLSARWLLLLMAIACLYFASWPATKSIGVVNVYDYSKRNSGDADEHALALHMYKPVAPLLVHAEIDVLAVSARRRWRHDFYYLWLFGPVIKLGDFRVEY